MRPGAASGQTMIRAHCQSEESRADSSWSDGIVRTRATPYRFQDSDLRRPMAAWLPGAYDLRALSWAHVRVWGAAGRGWHTPDWLGIARCARSSYVNRALFGISTSADRWRPRWPRRSMPCARYVRPADRQPDAGPGWRSLRAAQEKNYPTQVTNARRAQMPVLYGQGRTQGHWQFRAAPIYLGCHSKRVIVSM